MLEATKKTNWQLEQKGIKKSLTLITVN